jgi:endonuclease YncB( thermonuclease family)
MRTLGAAVLAVLLVVAPASAETVDGSRLYILDGDTVSLGRERIRIANIDSPEIFHPECGGELQDGLAAKDLLGELLRGHQVTIARGKRKDPYFRTLATLATEEGDIGDLMIRYTRSFRWQAGAKAKAWRIAQWCK